MTTQQEIQRTQRLDRSAQRAMDSLDRQDERLNDHYSVQRKYARHDLRTMAVVLVPPRPDASIATTSESESPSPPPESERIVVWVRNVSPTGMSFVYPKEFTQKKLLVGLNPSPGSVTWFHAEVMRVRKAMDDFWEYGLAFRGRAGA